jgi:class 3 adenylate cyclase/pimeloyl-ACP methyl ester carboxylesterase
MMTEAERRLLAIMFTDIVGYTAMVGENEAAGIEAREDHRRLIQNLASQFHGEFVDESGDSSLSTFASAVDAVKCAMAIQAVLAAEPAYQVRAGIHVGDVVERDGRLIGDGINVASRLPALAEPGGIVATDRVVEHLRNQRIASEALGSHKLKNVAQPVPLYTISGSMVAAERASAGSRRRAWVGVGLAVLAALASWLFLFGGINDALIFGFQHGLMQTSIAEVEKEITFTSASDGVRIAYATAGLAEGPPVVVVLGWASHLESPAAFGFSMGLLDRHRVVVYDGRGTGLSDRGIEDFSLEGRIRDLEAVVEAAGLERFGILAVSAGGPTAIAYAVRHPERVTRIAFYGSFLSFAGIPKHHEKWRSFPALVRVSWGEDNPAFRELFSRLFFPDGSDLMIRFFNELQRMAMTPEDAAGFISALAEVDVRDLAPGVDVPTLVLHRRGDQVVPYPLGREIAALIPRTKLVGMDGNNHAPGVTEVEAYEVMNRELAEFFSEDPRESAP